MEGSKMQIKVLLADDHSLLRQGVRQILELERDIEIVGEASDGEEALELIKETNPDVILLDVNMPKLNGVEVARKIKEQRINVGIIVLTIHQDREYLFELVKIGISGYLLKDIDSNSLIKAIRVVHQGESYLHPEMTTYLLKEFNRLNQSYKNNIEQNPLTAREQEVLQMIAQGKSNREIAKGLFISEKTVKNHLSNVFRKLEVNDRTQAVLYGLKNDLIEL
jgi:DNA-binding NarL/FixJ family response regulator